MKKKIIGYGLILSSLLFVPVALATPAVPAQCSSMTFDHTIVSTTYGASVQGTSDRDLIFVTGGSFVDAKGGNDCIVTSQGGNYILGGNGNDKIVFNGWGNAADGGAGVNDCYFSGGDYATNCNIH